MSRYQIIVGALALGFAAGPAFAQTAPGTVAPRHVTHPAPAHKMPKAAAVHPDSSADMLNAKELASIQHGTPAPAPAPAPAAKP